MFNANWRATSLGDSPHVSSSSSSSRLNSSAGSFKGRVFSKRNSDFDDMEDDLHVHFPHPDDLEQVKDVRQEFEEGMQASQQVRRFCQGI
jgi:hypothetical protein